MAGCSFSLFGMLMTLHDQDVLLPSTQRGLVSRFSQTPKSLCLSLLPIHNEYEWRSKQMGKSNSPPLSVTGNDQQTGWEEGNVAGRKALWQTYLTVGFWRMTGSDSLLGKVGITLFSQIDRQDDNSSYQVWRCALWFVRHNDRRNQAIWEPQADRSVSSCLPSFSNN